MSRQQLMILFQAAISQYVDAACEGDKAGMAEAEIKIINCQTALRLL